MAKIAVLGAGYMGGAITFPLARNGHDVRLWGTWLDDDLVRACRDGLHPKLKMALPDPVTVFDSPQLAHAVAGVDAIFIAIASEGFGPVFERLLPHIGPAVPLFSLTKGFIPVGDRVLRVSQAAADMGRRHFGQSPLKWASIGGPVKAVELADGIPTASVYALSDPALGAFLPLFRTPTYRTIPSFDIAGVELCASLKNAFAIILGICDGLYRDRPHRYFDNAKAFLLAASVEEMAVIVAAGGGHQRSVFGLPGVGDLYVTAQSGRNRKFGELIGSGLTAGLAYRQMHDAGEIAEGYHALQRGRAFVQQIDPGLFDSLRVFPTLHRIVCEDEPLDDLTRLFESFP